MSAEALAWLGTVAALVAAVALFVVALRMLRQGKEE